MKKTLRNGIGMALLAGLNLCNQQTVIAQTWETVGTAGFSASGSGVSNWQRLLVDQYNNLYLSYNDEGFGTNAGQGTIMKYNGTTWAPVGTPGFTQNFSHHSDFTFGNGDTLYYSYADGSSTAMSRAAVMMFNGTAWSTIGSLLTVGECQYSSIAHAHNGDVYLGMIDNGVSGGAVKVKKYSGGTWTDVGTNPISTPSGASYADMVLDRHDSLYVAYTDMSESPGKVRVKKFNGTDWVNVGSPMLAITGPGAGSAMDIYLAFDIFNTPYVSYSHTFQGPPRISVEKFNGTDWELVGPAQFSSGTFETSLFSSLALPKNAPYVAYQHGGLGMKATVKKYNSTSLAWEDVGTPGISDDVAAFTSIALDGNGNVYVAFFDQAHGNMNTVKKFVTCEAPVITAVTTQNTPVCQDSAVLTVAGTLNDATDWKWYSGSCNNGTLVGTGAALHVKPNASTAYYVKGLGGCVATGGCNEVMVDVAVSKPTITKVNNVFTSSAATGNQWYRNNASITGATNQTYTATEPGYYQTKVTAGTCTIASDSLQYQPTGISTIPSHAGINVYPVPVNDYLHVNFEDAKLFQQNNWQLRITDKLGREVYNAAVKSTTSSIDMKHYASGLYFVTLYSNETRIVYKVAKD